MLLECFGPLIQPVVSILKGAPKPSQTTTIKGLIFPPRIFVGSMAKCKTMFKKEQTITPNSIDSEFVLF